jgi:hypothetical protein
VRISISVGADSFRARSTAVSVAAFTLSTSCPSTTTPGMLYAAARS